MFHIANNENYDLRSKNKTLMLSKPKTNTMKRSFSYLATKVWNNRTRETVVPQNRNFNYTVNVFHRYFGNDFYTFYILQYLNILSTPR